MLSETRQKAYILVQARLTTSMSSDGLRKHVPLAPVLLASLKIEPVVEEATAPALGNH